MAKKTKHKKAKEPNLIVIWEHIPDKDDEQALFMAYNLIFDLLVDKQRKK